MITKIIRKQFFCVTVVRAMRELLPRAFSCVIGIQRTYLMETPELHEKYFERS